MSTKFARGDQEEEKDRLHITDQFRDRGSMVYDFKGQSVSISLRVSERSDLHLPWEMVVTVKHLPPIPALTAIAATRGDALAGLERAWQEADGMPSVHWPSIRDALVAVRAI